MAHPFSSIPAYYPGDNEVATGHAYSTGDEDALSSKLINPQHSGNGPDEFKNTNDSSGQERRRITIQADLAENLGTVEVRRVEQP